jgi:hypothetical protein
LPSSPLSGATTAQTFPADNTWVPVTVGNVVIEDDDGDCLEFSCEIVGAAPIDQPSVLVASDANFLYFRLRLAVPPTANDVDWACELDVDRDITNSYEYYVGFFSSADPSMAVQTWFNSTKADEFHPVPQDVAETFIAGHDSTFTAIEFATIGDPGNAWRSWAIPWTDLQQLGFEVTPSTPLSILCGTRKAGTVNLDVSITFRADLAGDGTFSDPIHPDDVFHSGFE